MKLRIDFRFCTIASLGVKQAFLVALGWFTGMNGALSASWDAMVDCDFGLLFHVGISRISVPSSMTLEKLSTF